MQGYYIKDNSQNTCTFKRLKLIKIVWKLNKN